MSKLLPRSWRWIAGWQMMLLVLISTGQQFADGNSSSITCRPLEWGQEEKVVCSPGACDAVCRVGCGSLEEVFTNGVFSSTAEAALQCHSLEDCPANSSAAVDVVARVQMQMVLDEYARGDAPMTAAWEDYGITNITSINVVGTIPDPLANWGVPPRNDNGLVRIDAEASVLEGPTDVFVVVRGSEFTFADWISTNANVEGVRMDSLGGHRVHRGFMTYAMALEPEITQALQESCIDGPCERNLWFTGHSMGGAVAVLLAMFYQLQYVEQPDSPLGATKIAGVYTYGAPKSGDEDFAAAYDAILGSITYRYVNRDANLNSTNFNHKFDDFVTLVPPSLRFGTSYTHVGRYIAIFSDGVSDEGSPLYFSQEADSNSMPLSWNSVLEQINAKSLIRRHSSVRYMNDLTQSILTNPGMTEKDLCIFKQAIESMSG